VFVLTAQAQVDAALDQLFTHFADAAQQVIIEEYLEGPELSLLALTDGEQLALLPPARDYKRLLDDDRGPNTGGMGGQTWPDYATSSLLEEVEQHVLRPTLAGMAAEGHPYRGILYAGLMLTRFGPKVLEFNCRFGDPECQLIMPLLASSLFEACASVAAGKLATNLRWRTERTLGVVLTAEGYPDAPRAGDPIEGLDELPAGVLAFHAGTRRDGARLVTAGGRVVTLVGFDPTAVYEAAQRVRFAGKHYRRDIGASVAAPLAS
jgi:phosphoribosylamine--glycine ligase